MRAEIACLLALGACADPPATVTDLRLTAPVGVAELVPMPGEALTVAWTATATGAATLRLALAPGRPGDPEVALGDVDLALGALTWPLPAPAPRAGTFQIVAVAHAGADVLAERRGSAIVIVQGVEFRDAELTFAAADVERDVWITATLGQPIDVELRATPRGAAAPSYLLATTHIASDLAPIGRVFRWTGAALDDAALPAGSYDVAVTVAPQGRAGTYQAGGLVVHWAP